MPFPVAHGAHGHQYKFENWPDLEHWLQQEHNAWSSLADSVAGTGEQPAIVLSNEKRDRLKSVVDSVRQYFGKPDAPPNLETVLEFATEWTQSHWDSHSRGIQWCQHVR